MGEATYLHLHSSPHVLCEGGLAIQTRHSMYVPTLCVSPQMSNLFIASETVQ